MKLSLEVVQDFTDTYTLSESDWGYTIEVSPEEYNHFKEVEGKYYELQAMLADKYDAIQRQQREAAAIKAAEERKLARDNKTNVFNWDDC